MQNRKIVVVILAAGKGTRMKSDRAKVLHPLAGKPLLEHVLRTARQLEPSRISIIVGHQADAVQQAFLAPDIEFILQAEQKGTGHAVMQSVKPLAGFNGAILILCGDMPLIQVGTLQGLLKHHWEHGPACTFLSLKTSESRDFGRVVRDQEGQVQRIVEHRDATAREKTIDEYNSGVYCFDKDLLFKALEEIRPDNSQSEYYLTDVIPVLLNQGHRIEAVSTTNEAEIFGINSLEDLQRAEHLISAGS